MSEEPELTSMPVNPATRPGMETSSAPSPYPHGDVMSHPQRIPRWLEGSELFLRVLLRMYLGFFVFYAPWSRYAPIPFLPWTALFWDHNPLFIHFPTLGHYASLGAVRGIISGLGLLNLWIAFREALRHRDG